MRPIPRRMGRDVFLVAIVLTASHRQAIVASRGRPAKKGGATELLRWLKRGVRRVIRGTLSWASLFAIPLGIGVGLMGHRTLGALLVLGGTLAYFLVDPILFILDLKPSEEPEQQQGGQRRSGR
jgi:hypothetical protein